jgi:hypothetical protein
MSRFKVGDRVNDSRYPRVKGTITNIDYQVTNERPFFDRPIEVRWDDSDHRERLSGDRIKHLSVIVRLAELVDDDV